MKEATGDLWSFPAGAMCITTNGDVNRNGEAVMGRGCALQATEKIPNVRKDLGDKLQEFGNHVHWLGLLELSPGEWEIVLSFPVKHSWHQPADPELIMRSATELMGVSTVFCMNSIVLPRPGCGNGKLAWEDVRPLLTQILDDRFTVITNE